MRTVCSTLARLFDLATRSFDRAVPLGAATLLALTACGPSVELEPEGAGTQTEAGSTTSAPASTGGTTDAAADESSSGFADASSSADGPSVACGDGVVEGEERCDDGNAVDGDGCSALCQPSGEVLTSFTWPGDDHQAHARAVASVPTGYVVAGWHEVAPMQHAALVMGLTPELEVAWTTDIVASDPGAWVSAASVAVDDGGGVWIAGSWSRAGDHPGTEPFIARLSGEGVLQWSRTFERSDPDTLSEERYFQLVVLPGGDVAAVGIRQSSGGSSRPLVRRHAADDGAIVWAQDGTIDDPQELVLAATPDPDGFVTAGWRLVAASARLVLTRYGMDGAIEESLYTNVQFPTSVPLAVAVDPSGALIVCGFTTSGSNATGLIARFGADFEPAPLWSRELQSADGGEAACKGLVVESSGDIDLVGTAFTTATANDGLVGRMSNDGTPYWSTLVTANPDAAVVDSAEGLVADELGLLLVGSTHEVDDRERVWVARVRR